MFRKLNSYYGIFSLFTFFQSTQINCFFCNPFAKQPLASFYKYQCFQEKLKSLSFFDVLRVTTIQIVPIRIIYDNFSAAIIHGVFPISLFSPTTFSASQLPNVYHLWLETTSFPICSVQTLDLFVKDLSFIVHFEFRFQFIDKLVSMIS